MSNYEYQVFKEFDCSYNSFYKIQKDIKILKKSNCEFISYLSKDIYGYIELKEREIETNKLNDIELFLDKNYQYKIEFTGESKGDVEASIWVVTYLDNEELYTQEIELNTSKEIEEIEESQNIKLVIRVEKKGIFKINSIKIYRRNRLEEMVYRDISELNVNFIEDLKKLRVACIFDEFTTRCYEDMCELIKITPENWRIELTIRKPHLLMVESAWHGNSYTWDKKVQDINNENTKELENLVEWCKKNNIPTVFWNKEDPVHFNNFIKIASFFEYIFTTDEGSIDEYKKKLKNDNVYKLLFAAQPKKHNPIKIYDKREEKACFAGTYYERKYPERAKALVNILRVAKEKMGVDIYDRQYGLNLPQYKYPEEFKEEIKGCLMGDEIDKANKGYKVMLNVNTVTDSKTMFSRRVFESLACGTPVVSTKSIGILDVFKGLVVATNDIKELEEEFDKLNDEEYYNKKVVSGLREIFKNHTYEQRIRNILEVVGIKIRKESKKVVLLSKINNKDEYFKVIEMYKNQSYENKELYVLVEDWSILNELIINRPENSKILLISSDLVNQKLKEIKSDYIGYINPNSVYGKYYLEDLINATLYSNAGFIGKKSYIEVSEDGANIINKGKEFEYVDKLDLDKSIVRLEEVEELGLNKYLSYIEGKDKDFLKVNQVYLSIDKYNLTIKSQ